MTNKLIFDRANTNNWGDNQSKLIPLFEEYRKSNRSFDVIFSYHDEVKETKTFKQLKGLYKLFALSRPYFEKWKPKLTWDDEKIKEYVKEELGYVIALDDFEVAMAIKQTDFIPKNKDERKIIIDHCRDKRKNRSFKSFTKKETYDFTMEFEVWAQTPDKEKKKDGWPDVFLTSAEQMAMDTAYGFTKKEKELPTK